MRLRACVALVRPALDDTARQDLADALEDLRALIDRHTDGDGGDPPATAGLGEA